VLGEQTSRTACAAVCAACAACATDGSEAGPGLPTPSSTSSHARLGEEGESNARSGAAHAWLTGGAELTRTTMAPAGLEALKKAAKEHRFSGAEELIFFCGMTLQGGAGGVAL